MMTHHIYADAVINDAQQSSHYRIDDVEEIDQLSKWLHELASQHQFDSAMTDKLNLCLVELLSNTILHGEARPHRINIHLQYADNQSTVLTLTDDGKLFNPLSIAAPTRFTTLQEAKIGGLGVFLTVKLAKECHYSCEDGKNNMILIF